MFELLFLLLGSHAVCDFALQSEAMAKGKNRNRPIDPASVPPGQKMQPVWTHWLTAHAFVHGLGVALVTGVWWLGLLETICHWAIDFGKCESLYGINTDQALHIACKVIWAAAVVFLL